MRARPAKAAGQRSAATLAAKAPTTPTAPTTKTEDAASGAMKPRRAGVPPARGGGDGGAREGEDRPATVCAHRERARAEHRVHDGDDSEGDDRARLAVARLGVAAAVRRPGGKDRADGRALRDAATYAPSA